MSAGPLLFDRCFGSLTGNPTPVGNGVCDMALAVQSALDHLPEPIPLNNQVEQDVRRALAVVLEGAVNENSIRTFNQAGHRQEEIVGDIQGYLNDPQCGVNGQLRFLEQYFNSRIHDFENLGQDIQVTARIVDKVGAAGQEGVQIIQQVSQLVQLVNKSGSEAQRQFTILKNAVNQLGKNTQEALSLDLSVIGDTGDVALSIGPWLGSCAGCAGLLVDAAKNISIGSTSTAASTAGCPESAAAAGGSCWVIIPGVTITGTGAVEGALSAPVCSMAGDGLNKLEEYKKKLEKLFATIEKLVTSTQRSLRSLQTASQALVRLAATLPQEAQPRIDAIRQGLNRAGNDLNEAAEITNSQLLPALSSQSTARLTELGENVSHLLTCYHKTGNLAQLVGQRIIQGFSDMNTALSHLVNGSRVFNNIKQHGQQGISAASAYITRELSAMKRQLSQLHQDVFGVPPGTVDPGRTVLRFIELAGNEGRRRAINNKLDSLTAAIAALPTRALNIGKEAFLADSRQEQGCASGSACNEFRLVGSAAGAALRSFSALPPLREQQTSISMSHVRLPALNTVPANLKYARLNHLNMLRATTSKSTGTVAGNAPQKTPRLPVSPKQRPTRDNTGRGKATLHGYWTGAGGHGGINSSAKGLTLVQSLGNHRLRLYPGGKPVQLQIKGQNLHRITSTQIWEGSKPSRTIKARLSHASKGTLTLNIQAVAQARPGREYRLHLVSGRESLVIPTRILTIEVTTPKKQPVSALAKPGLGSKITSSLPVVRSTTPNRCRVQAGGKTVNLTLRGENLETIHGVQIMRNNRPVREVRGKISRKSAKSLTVMLSATPQAQNHQRYTLRLLAGKNHLDVPARVALVEIQAPTHVAGRPGAVTIGKPGKRTNTSDKAAVTAADKRVLRLQAGGRSGTITLRGKHLGNINKARILLNRRPVRELAARISRKTDRLLVITISAAPQAHPARNHSIELLAPHGNLVVPLKIAAVETMPGAPRGKTIEKQVRTTGSTGHVTSGRPKKGQVDNRATINSCKPSHARLHAGGQSVTLTLRGKRCNLVRQAQVIDQGKPVGEIAARILKKSDNTLTLRLTANSRTGTRRNLTLLLIASRNKIKVPATILSIEVSAAKPGKKPGPMSKGKR